VHRHDAEAGVSLPILKKKKRSKACSTSGPDPCVAIDFVINPHMNFGGNKNNRRIEAATTRYRDGIDLMAARYENSSSRKTGRNLDGAREEGEIDKTRVTFWSLIGGSET
jgi:hypothetical protein